MPDPFAVGVGALTKLLVVGTVRTPEGHTRPIRVIQKPTPRELTLLFALGEHVSRPISIDDICHRLKASPNAIRIAATRLRAKLSDDWAIMTDPNVGMRLVYVQSDLADATRTYVDFDTKVTSQFHHRRRRID